MQTRNFTILVFPSEPNSDVTMIGIYDDSDNGDLMCMMSAIEPDLIMLCISAATRLVTDHCKTFTHTLCNVKYASEIPGMIQAIVAHLAPHTVDPAPMAQA